MKSTWLILAVPLGAIIGIFLSSLVFKLKTKSSEKKLIADAQKVLNGEKENTFDLDGKKLDVKRFKVRNDDEKEVVMTFGDGKIKEEAIEEKKEEKVEKVVFLEDKKKPKKKVNIQLLSGKKGKKDKKVKKERIKKK